MDKKTVGTPAWRFQIWTSFVLSFGATLIGIYFLPAGLWVKGFMTMGLLFTVGSTFSLSKTVRDAHEAERFVNRVRDAKTEAIIRDYEQVA